MLLSRNSDNKGRSYEGASRCPMEEFDNDLSLEDFGISRRSECRMQLIVWETNDLMS